MDGFRHGLIPDKKERLHTEFKDSKVRSIVDGAAINLLNIPRNVQLLFKAYKNGLKLDYTEHRLGSLTHHNLFNLLGSLYKHDVCKPDYVDHGMDKIEDPRLKSVILSLAYKYGLKMDYRVHKINQMFPDYLRLGILLNAYTAGNLPDRDLHEFSKFPDVMKIRILEKAYSHGLVPLFDEDLPTGSDDALRVAAIRNMYTAGLQKSLAHTDVISTDSQKALIIEEVYRSGITAMKCHLKDRMPRSNGVVKKFGKLQKPFQTRLRIQRLVLKRLPIDRDVQRLIFTKMPRQQCNEIV